MQVHNHTDEIEQAAFEVERQYTPAPDERLKQIIMDVALTQHANGTKQQRGRGFIKFVASFTAGAGAYFLTLAPFALSDPARWDYNATNRLGPPLGPVMLASGVGLMTAAVLLGLLFLAPWARQTADA